MIQHRPAQERGHANYGWLDTWHTFSFADYHDPAHVGWGPLRVINDDTVQPGGGFGTHSHRDMEIVSVVLAGALAHKDSMGNGTTISPGEIQRMSAGKGVMHSEFNAAESATRFLQIWIQPTVKGGEPSYEQRRLDEDGSHDDWQALVSGDGREGSLRIQQDAILYRTRLAAGQSRTLSLAPGRLAYAHLISGAASVSGTATPRVVLSLSSGDGAKIADETSLIVTAREACDLLMFDLPH